MTQPINAITPMPEIGVLHCSGPDTLHFLQGQLSNDFALMRHHQARLAAFLSAKGRMQANFIAVRYGPHDVLLLAHQSILAAVHKRLSMFVLRAKVKITDASSAWQLNGALGDAAQSALASLNGAALESAAVPWQCCSNADAQSGIVSASLNQTDAGNTAATAPNPNSQPAHAPIWAVALYPAAGQPRALIIRPTDTPLPGDLAKFAPAVSDNHAALAGQWAWTEVMSGIATISAPVVDLFVPQMLNYESVGGVNFKKGCYPGQEIVARSQFRGAIKRRAYLAHGQAAQWPQAGDEIYSTADPEQPCGTVVQVAANPQDAAHRAFDAIVSVKTDVAEQSLFIRPAAEHDGAETSTRQDIGIALTSAPYPLLEDI